MVRDRMEPGMTEQSFRWNEYYREVKPSARKRIFEKLLAEGPDDGADPLRKLLFTGRYVDPKDPEHEVDRFLFECVNLIQIFHSGRIFRRMAQKELLRIAGIFHLEDAEKYGKPGEEALYNELRNTAKCYFRTCAGTGYRRGTFGLVSSSAQEKKRQMVKDAWEMSLGVTQRMKEEERFRIWNRAVSDQLFAGDPDAETLFREYYSEHGRR